MEFQYAGEHHCTEELHSVNADGKLSHTRRNYQNLGSNNPKAFSRSLSQPEELSNSYCKEPRNPCTRTKSQPCREDTHDINDAIHKELLNSPWKTYRRPTKRDRYAMYVPNKSCAVQDDAQDWRHHNESNHDRTIDLYDGAVSPSLFESEMLEPSGSIFATYRRAPRTYPRLDLSSQSIFREVNRINPSSRDRRRDGMVLNSLSDLEYIPNEMDGVTGGDDGHTNFDALKDMQGYDNKRLVRKQPSVKHLFSIRLNDVKQSHVDNRSVIREDNKTQQLKTIRNNLSETVSNGFIKRKKHRKMPVGDEENASTKKPFFYCRWVTEYPKTLFLLTFGGHLMIAIITVATLLAGYDLFPTEFEILPMFDLQVPWLKRDFAWRFRDDYEERYVRKWYIQSLNKWYRSMAYDRANIVLYYDAGNGNIFTKETLQRMQTIENEIVNMKNYTQFCEQTVLQKCQKLTSVIRYFDGTYANIDPIFRDPNFTNIPKVLYTAKTNNATKGDFAYFLSDKHYITEINAYAPVTRTLIPMGFPLKLEQDREEMEDEMEKFLVKIVNPTIKKLQESSTGFKIIYWSFLLFKHDIVIQIFYDMAFALGSVCFIFGFIVYHTKSLWISTFAVASILTSFLCTNIIYRVVLDFHYFGFFHVITLFIILGIGADDLFVFLDVWKDTGFESHPSLGHRLSAAYKKSMQSMFYTSLTTTVAFIVNSVSPLLATKSFGVFSALLVIVNYISVVVYFPTVVTLHHLYFKHWHWPCFSFLSRHFRKVRETAYQRKANSSENKGSRDKGIKINDLFDDNSAIGTSGNKYNVVGTINPSYKPEDDDEYGFVRFKNNRNGTDHINVIDNETNVNRLSEHIGETSAIDSAIAAGKTKKKKLLVRFFRDHYFRFVTHWLIKWIILIILSALVVFFSYCTSTIETDNKPIQFYRNSHNYGKALDLDFNGFVANKNDRNVVVYILWGLKERDMSSCHFSDPRCIGVESFDEEFNPNSVEAQIALKKFCEKLHGFSASEIEDFKIRRDFTTGLPEIRCFARNLDFFLKMESLDSGQNWTLPWDYRKTISFMQSKSLLYNTLKLNSSFPHVLEVPISYWLNDRYQFKNKNDFDKFHELIGEEINYFSTPLKTDFSVFYGNRIVYLAVQVNLTLGRFSSGYLEGKPVMDRWETFVQNEVRNMPSGLNKGFQLTKDYWHNLSVQKSIEESAIFGIVVGIGLAFPLLTFATQNVIIGFLATLSMCCSTICVVGIIPLAGYKLGILESLNMCMVVGLTVDYVVHLAEGYHMSSRHDRKSRVQDMLEIMGISVFSGACTTLGASLFMFFAQIQFIIRFGMFMFCTIGFSLLYSLGFFTTLMGIVGPNGEAGNIKVMCRKLFDKCRKRDNR